MLPVFVHAFFNVDKWLHTRVMVIDYLLVILNVLHPVLVSRVDIDSRIIDLVDLRIIIIKVAHWIIKSNKAPIDIPWYFLLAKLQIPSSIDLLTYLIL